MTTFILGALLAATLTLPAFVRLIRQRDAAATKLVRAMFRNDVLMQQLDAQIEDTGEAREGEQTLALEVWERDLKIIGLGERVAQLEAEALPKAPNWGAAPAEWLTSDECPHAYDGLVSL